MKNYLLITLLCLFTLTNCSLGGDNNIDEQQTVRVLWQLENVSGGIEGVDNDFDPNVVVWEFDEVNANLTVENNNATTSLEDGLNTGTYSYYLEPGNTDEEAYLIIDTTEFGRITVTSSTLVIDQNFTTNGNAADGYIYTFSKQIIVEN